MMKAFTLIELLVVISIISLLASIVTTNLEDSRNEGKAAQIKQQLSQISTAASLHKSNTGNWSPDVGRGSSPTFVTSSEATLGDWPAPPCPGASYDWNYRNDNDVSIGIRDISGFSVNYSIVPTEQMPELNNFSCS